MSAPTLHFNILSVWLPIWLARTVVLIETGVADALVCNCRKIFPIHTT
jgi:hypothetical protein